MLQKASRWPHSQGKKHPESSTLKRVADMHSCQAWCSEFGYLVVESANKLRLKAAVFGVQIEDDMQGKLKTNPRKRKWLAFWWEYSSSGSANSNTDSGDALSPSIQKHNFWGVPLMSHADRLLHVQKGTGQIMHAIDRGSWVTCVEHKTFTDSDLLFDAIFWWRYLLSTHYLNLALDMCYGYCFRSVVFGGFLERGEYRCIVYYNILAFLVTCIRYCLRDRTLTF